MERRSPFCFSAEISKTAIVSEFTGATRFFALAYASMKLKKYPDLLAFLQNYVAEVNQGDDEAAALTFQKSNPNNEKASTIVSQIQSLIAAGDLPVDEFGSEANRWFENGSEASMWLGALAAQLSVSTQNEQSTTVKDSNGTPLQEGDSVQVIKDLKVKGGSSDLKRGTLIKKIHLIGDPNNIECKVDGSTLVLKTIFLKKS